MIVHYICLNCGSKVDQIEDLSDYPYSECECGTIRQIMTSKENILKVN